MFILFAFILLNAFSAIAGPNRTTYQAKIIKPDGYPLEAGSVNFKFTILDPAGSCILYSESYSSVNMVSTGGVISFSLGSGVKTYPVSATTFENVFSNITPALACDAGGLPTYAPGANDIRKIVMQFHDGNGWQTLPAMSINAVPYAMYANEAQKLNGKTEADFVQVSTLPMTCGVSEALRFNGAAFSCIAVGGAVTSGSVITALGYTPADGASITTLTSSLGSTNSNVSAVSSTVSVLSSNLNTVSSAVAGLSASMSTITSSQWLTSGSTISYNGNVGVRTTTPVTAFDVSGGIRIGGESATCAPSFAGTLRYNAGNVEYCNGTAWTAFGVSGAGLLSINGLVSGSQTFAFGSAGNFPNVSSVGSVHTFNFPFASAGTTTAGVISNADYLLFSNKITSSAASIAQVLGYTPASASALANYLARANNLSDLTSSVAARTNLGLGGFATVSSLDLGSASATGILAEARLPSFANITSGAQYTKVTVDGKGRVTSGAQLASSDVTTALGYTPASASAATQWATSGTGISYSAGNVSINPNKTFLAQSTVGSEAGEIELYNSATHNMNFRKITSGSFVFSGGNVGVGTATPVTRLDVSGGIRIGSESATCAPSFAGTLRYNAGVVEYCNGSAWTAFGVSGAGILAINGLASGSQTFAFGSSGNFPNVSSVASVHTFNFPFASAGTTTAGVISNTDYLNFTNKITSSAASIAQVLGYVPASATALGNYLVKANNLSDLTSSASARTNLGLGGFATVSSLDLGTASATGILAEARLPSFANITSGSQYTKVTVDGKGRVTSGAQLSITDVTTALGYTPASASASSQWTTSGTTINYSTGNVGLGTNIPQAKLDILDGGLLLTETDVAHGMTGWDPTNTFGSMKTDNAVDGGLKVTGFSDGVGVSGLSLHGLIGVADPTDSVPAIVMNGAKKAGTGQNALGLLETVFQIQNASSAKLTMLGSGNVGVGTVTPAARLHITSGTSTLAPFKLTSGTLLSSPVSGAIEFDGFNYYITDGADIRRAIATVATPGTFDNASVISASGHISMVPAGSVIVSSTTASTNSQTGALIVKGGLGVAGNIYSSGTIITSSNIQGSSITATSGMIAPYIYGSTVSGGSLYLESTTHATKGDIILGAGGSYVGIGTSSPAVALHVKGIGPANLILERENVNSSGIEFKNTAGSIFAGINSAASFGISPTSNLNGATFVVTASSTVGIGTTTPANLLDMYEAASPTLRIRSASNDAASGPTIRLVEDLTENGGFVRYQSILNALDLGVVENGVENTRLSINRTTGNVGIGATIPSTLLEISSAVSGDAEVLIEADTDDNQESDNAFLHLKQDGNLIHGYLGFGGNANEAFNLTMTDVTANALVLNSTSANLQLATSNTVRMTVMPAGNIGIGHTAPTARLHLASGTTSLAPLKLTSGSLLSAASPGSIEYDGTDFYITDGNSIRRTIATATSAGTIDNVSIVSSPAGIALWPAAGNSITVSATTASTNSTTGALIVKGGLGVAGNIYSAGTIITSSDVQGASITATSGMIAPYIYGSTASGGSLRLESTTNVNKGNIFLAANGGNVAIGNTTPTSPLHILGSSTNSTTPWATIEGGGGVLDNISLRLFDRGSGANNNNILEFAHATAAASAVATSRIRSLGQGTGNVSGSSLYLETASDSLSTWNDHQLVLNRSGNVGVGTSTPASKFEVIGEARFLASSADYEGMKFQTSYSNNETSSRLLFAERQDNAYGWSLVDAGLVNPVLGGTTLTGIAAGSFNIVRHEASAVGVPALSIDRSSGNMGIGVSIPVARLAIEGAGAVGLQIKTTGALAIDTFNMVNDMDTNGNFWFSKGSSNGIPASMNRLMNITNEGNVEIYGQQVDGTTDKSGVLGLKTESSADGGTKNEVSLEFYADRTNLNTRSGYVGYESNTVFDLTLMNARTGKLILGASNTTAITIASSGAVGIGVAAPLYKLDASGGARLTAVNGSYIYTERPDSEIDIYQGAGSVKRSFSIHAAQGGGDVVNIYANTGGSFTQALSIKNATGYVGIQHSNAAYPLDVGGVVNIVSGSSLRFGGTIVCTSAGCTSSSDKRLKENIKSLDFSLENLLSLNAVEYDWKDKQKFGDQHQIGFIAQDLEKVYPEVVMTDKDSGMKSVSYDKLVAPIIEALKVFHKRIAQLFDRTEKNAREIASVKEQNAELKARVEKSEKENAELKKRLERIEKALLKDTSK